MNIKPFLYILTLSFFMAACGGTEQKSETASGSSLDTAFSYFGDTLDNLSTAVSLETFETMMEENNNIENTMLTANVAEVCQAKGCWMNISLSNGETMKVKFKDYAFFVPKDIAGKEIIIEGKAYTDTTSVDELKHYAEDAGKTQAEIDSITEPKIGYRFLASGVAIKK
jgi:hypothetical protein